jgi:hypothetical protein
MTFFLFLVFVFSKRRPVMLTLLRGSSLSIPSLKDPTARQFLAQIKSDAQNTITVRAAGTCLRLRSLLAL